jgi:hypothetical protein
MNSEGLKKKLTALRERRARIDAEIEQLEAQLDAQERTEKKGGEVLEVEPARGSGSYVLQRVRCGEPTCRCARAGGGVRVGGLMCHLLLGTSIQAYKEDRFDGKFLTRT